MEEEKSESYYFLHFSQRKDTGLIVFEKPEVIILPKHPATNDIDKYYLQSMLRFYNISDNDDSSLACNEILDAFPILSMTTDKKDKFYNISIARLREFACDNIEQDEYINSSLKHLFMENKIVTNKNLQILLNDCLKKAEPIMYTRNTLDAVDYEDYELNKIASYVPTWIYSRMKLLKGWIEGALHYYDYSIMFFDTRFVGFDDFNENIIDIKTKDLCEGGRQLSSWWCWHEHFLLTKSDLYYESSVGYINLKRNWLLTSPNNDNERDGKVMLFRNNDLKSTMEQFLTNLFRKNSFRVNDVFKWNRYNHGGSFNSHFDTMFVSKTSDECSLYSLLVYLDVENEDNFLYLGDEEFKVQLKSNTAYVIPHWVRHRVDGTGMRQFIKAEIVFKNKDMRITYDQTIADHFDQSCYYMLQSLRHPQLKDFVSKSFNSLNEARFYKEHYMTKLIGNIFLLKEFSLPLKYSKYDDKCITIDKFNVSFITDGNYYYFKTASPTDISRCEATLMLSMMQLDIQPRKLFTRKVDHCTCGHPCEEFSFNTTDIDVKETVFYWDQTDAETNIDQKLQSSSFPYSTLYDIKSIGNTSIADLKKDNKTFYFAACQNLYEVVVFFQTRMTKITSNKGNGDYSGLDVTFIGPKKDIVKIRQSSFNNGIKVKQIWVKDKDDDSNDTDDNNSDGNNNPEVHGEENSD